MTYKIKIIYYANIEMKNSDGVTKKILAQLSQWKNNDADIALWAHGLDEEINKKLQDLNIKFIDINELNKNIINDYLITNNPDIIYARNISLRTALTFKEYKGIKIFEVNSIEKNEDILHYNKKSMSKKLSNAIKNILIRKEIRSWHIISVTNEISSYLKKKYKCIDYHVIPNGIDIPKIERAPKKNQKKDSNNRHKLFFIGTTLPTIETSKHWHGIDKIIEFSKKHPDLVELDIVGIKKIDGLEIPKNIRFHGEIPFNKISEIIINADVCIGTLALHRKGMNEASPLKLLEYISLHKPVIYAHKFTNIEITIDNKSIAGLLELPNEENNFIKNESLILEFINNSRKFEFYEKNVINSIDSINIEEKRFCKLIELKKS